MLFPLMGILVALFFLTFSVEYQPDWFYNWKGIRPQIKDSVKYVRYTGYIPSELEGYLCKTSNHWSTWHWLIGNMTEREALLLRKHPHSVVKTLAYETLLMRNKNIQYFFDEILNDTTSIVSMSCGCEFSNFLISQYFIEFKFFLNKDGPPPQDNAVDILPKLDSLDWLIEKHKTKYLKYRISN